MTLPVILNGAGGEVKDLNPEHYGTTSIALPVR